jgi:hypothetical protein
MQIELFLWSYGQNHHRLLDNPHIMFPPHVKNAVSPPKKGRYRCEVTFFMFVFRWASLWCPVPCKLNYFWWSYGQNHNRFQDNPHTVSSLCKKCCIFTKKRRYSREVMFFMFFFRWARLWCPVTNKMNYFWWSYGQNHYPSWEIPSLFQLYLRNALYGLK